MTTAASILVLGALVLSGCGSQETPGGSTTSTAVPSGPGVASGDPFVVQPRVQIDGGTVHEVDGVSFWVPSGFEVERTENDAVVQHYVMEPGNERAVALITITAETKVTDSLVEESAIIMHGQLSTALPGTTSMRMPVRWEGMPHAVALRGTLALSGETGEKRDFVYIVTSDATQTHTVGISAEAPVGTLESSPGMQVLSTLRIQG